MTFNDRTFNTMTPVEGVLPPTPVRAAFALFIGDVVLAQLNAVIQLSAHIGGIPAVIGALIEGVLLVGLGTRMRAGRSLARVLLTNVAGVFVLIGVMGTIALRNAFTQHLGAMVIFALICVAAKLVLIVAATVLMYRPSTQGFFS